MSDLLSAASLLVSIVGLLYGVWYSEIKEALATVPPMHKADGGPKYTAVSEVLATRALPLTVAAVALAFTLLPDAIGIIRGSIERLTNKRLPAVMHYEAQQACFLVVSSFAAWLAATLLTTTLALRRLRSELRPEQLQR